MCFQKVKTRLDDFPQGTTLGNLEVAIRWEVDLSNYAKRLWRQQDPSEGPLKDFGSDPRWSEVAILSESAFDLMTYNNEHFEPFDPYPKEHR